MRKGRGVATEAKVPESRVIVCRLGSDRYEECTDFYDDECDGFGGFTDGGTPIQEF